MHAVAASSRRTTGPHSRAWPIPLEQVRWTTGFWAERFALARDVTLPAMGRLMEGTERTHFLENLRIAAGLSQGRHRGPKWNDGDFYKWLEAAAAIYAVSRDASLDSRMDGLIAIIAQAQAADGYIHTPVLIAQRNGQAVERFADPMHFEMYNMGHLMLAGCMHHRATGKTTLLSVARKAADYLDVAFACPTPAMARHGICPVHLTGLVELARTTSDSRYVELASRLLDMRDLVEGGDDDNQDRIPLRRQREAVGHAVRATYLYTGAADVFTETGDGTLLEALMPIWEDLVGRKLYITGGCGALHDGASPDGAIDQKTITRVHQAFGRPYQLPHSTAHNETCAAIGNLLWNARLHQIDPQARYGDVIEQALFNSVLAGMSLDGTRFFYTNTLRQLEEMPVPQRWPSERQAHISCYCCPPNVLRVLAQASGLAYAQDERGVFVTLYGGSELATTLEGGVDLGIRQETDYPWDGRVRLRVETSAPAEFVLRLRIPAWARGARVGVNGEPRMAAEPGTYHAIDRAWRAGDVVELELPMAARLIEAHPLVEEARNHVAIQRGPIVYCLESVDLPPDVGLMDVRIPRDAHPEPAGDGPGGTLVLRCPGVVVASSGWEGALYRELKAAPPRAIELRLVPYFAWGNRGKSEMSVWLPLLH
jgi:uncharacterized protein